MSEDHLTKPHSDRINQLAAKSVPGMAHWAGTGPQGKSCRLCTHARVYGYYATGGHLLKPISCRQFTAMMGGSVVKFDHRQDACRFFAENPEPPKLTKGT